jgi:hypothetical protein
MLIHIPDRPDHRPGAHRNRNLLHLRSNLLLHKRLLRRLRLERHRWARLDAQHAGRRRALICIAILPQRRQPVCRVDPRYRGLVSDDYPVRHV